MEAKIGNFPHMSLAVAWIKCDKIRRSPKLGAKIRPSSFEGSIVVKCLANPISPNIARLEILSDL